MNDQIYQDAKAALEKLGSKVPATWELLVRENVNYAIWSIVLGLIAFGSTLVIGILLIRHGARTKGYASEGCLAGGVFTVLISLLVLSAIVSNNLGMICAPNVTTAKEILKK